MLLICLLILAEAYHAVAHSIVLLGLFRVRLNDIAQRLYFVWDLLSVLACYAIIQRHHVLVLVHTIIHVLAVIHLLGYRNWFFKRVFELAEQRWREQAWWVIIIYILGTLEDIMVHVLNIYYLRSMIE
jgi:hypothetical protein